MGRYRPPAPIGSKYITAEGDRKLREELDHLWHVRRPEVTQAVSEAAALGDRSENAEYIYGKKMLREIDRRVRFLRKRLEDMTIVDSVPDDQSRIYFGAWVTLEDEAGDESRFRIVGPDESDAKAAHISMDSPVARAAMGKTVDDEMVVTGPNGTLRYWVVKIAYLSSTP